jgi:hypothetical protein
MKLANLAMVILLSASACAVGVRSATSAPGASIPVASRDDVSVVKTVLISNGLAELVRNWGVEDPEAEIVLSDTLTGCLLPPSQTETRRVTDALERLAQGQNVPADELRYRIPTPDQDLFVGPERRIPKSIVRACARTGSARLPPLAVRSPLRVVLEREDVIRSEFRVNPIAWKRRYPHAVGSISFSKPVYSDDRNLAAVSYARFRNGIGGGSFFCLVQRDSGSWRVMWQETLLIE